MAAVIPRAHDHFDWTPPGLGHVEVVVDRVARDDTWADLTCTDSLRTWHRRQRLPLPPSFKRKEGGGGMFEPDEVIDLTPKTLGAPSICFKQPRGVIISAPANSPYVTVRLDGEEDTRQIHVNNVVRRLPKPATRRASRPAKPLDLPAGMEEVTFW